MPNSTASAGRTVRESATPPTSFTITGSALDNRIVWGGYDAVYQFGRKVKPAYEDRPATLSSARRAFLHHLSPTR